MAWAEMFGALRERQFRLLWLGQATSTLGDGLVPVALSFAVIQTLDRSASALGVVLAAHTLPLVAFVLVGGVWADRLPRQLVMLGSDVVRGAVQLTAAVLLLSGAAELWHLIVLIAVYGIAEAFFHRGDRTRAGDRQPASSPTGECNPRPLTQRSVRPRPGGRRRGRRRLDNDVDVRGRRAVHNARPGRGEGVARRRRGVGDDRRRFRRWRADGRRSRSPLEAPAADARLLPARFPLHTRRRPARSAGARAGDRGGPDADGDRDGLLRGHVADDPPAARPGGGALACERLRLDGLLCVLATRVRTRRPRVRRDRHIDDALDFGGLVRSVDCRSAARAERPQPSPPRRAEATGRPEHASG